MPLLDFKVQFAYRQLLVETSGRQTLTRPLPVIEIALSHNGLSTADLAIIDSGSTFSLFSREIAEELEIDVLKGRAQRLATLGGPVLAYGHPIQIEIIPDLTYQAEVLFSEYPIPRNLLGHNGFFDHLTVALRSKLGLIYLNPET